MKVSQDPTVLPSIVAPAVDTSGEGDFLVPLAHARGICASSNGTLYLVDADGYPPFGPQNSWGVWDVQGAAWHAGFTVPLPLASPHAGSIPNLCFLRSFLFFFFPSFACFFFCFFFIPFSPLHIPPALPSSCLSGLRTCMYESGSAFFWSCLPEPVGLSGSHVQPSLHTSLCDFSERPLQSGV